LLNLPRSAYYYEPRPNSVENLRLMRLLDEQYTATIVDPKNWTAE
jgi:hypothetical protein